MYRAFWLDITTGRSIEMRRSDGEFDTHMQYVLDSPETFGLDGQRVKQYSAGPVPYEINEYPIWLTKPLLARWVKVNVDSRYVNFTTTDTVTRQALNAMQDFLIDRLLAHLDVFIAGDPSGRTISKLPSAIFLGLKRPGHLHYLADR